MSSFALSELTVQLTVLAFDYISISVDLAIDPVVGSSLKANRMVIYRSIKNAKTPSTDFKWILACTAS